MYKIYKAPLENIFVSVHYPEQILSRWRPGGAICGGETYKAGWINDNEIPNEFSSAARFPIAWYYFHRFVFRYSHTSELIYLWGDQNIFATSSFIKPCKLSPHKLHLRLSFLDRICYGKVPQNKDVLQGCCVHSIRHARSISYSLYPIHIYTHYPRLYISPQGSTLTVDQTV